ncbi:unnamed protein product [Penicillium salamii]|uniref:ATP-grasp domain-containing protein n=1 Tax=Penicillium salamii TaxID=1612424 RepID=A0A9W4J921_9EURO|nr:unnamed protein product [Penicillium salamii]CAG8103929.1 unnamed protein product [Penicillium salamii]CAG8380014.1 unnamed protein product [Penicillium salamii]CAG8383801.1 unnamed protein product [Penicillium salamii]CAG8384637.1 unnamed protein product [Penicillium salamii]
MVGSNLLIALIYEDPGTYLDLGYKKADIAHLEVGAAAEDIATAIIRLGHRYVPIPDVKTLANKLGSGEAAHWDLAVNITEGVHGTAREAQVPAMLEAFNIPYTFSDTATMALCLDKGKTKMVLEHYGIPTAPFAVVYLDKLRNRTITPQVICALTKTSKHARGLLNPSSYPLFVKPLAEGSSKGIKQSNVIHSMDELCRAVETIHSSATSAPAVLVEKFLTGREFTVGILGTGDDAWVLGVTEMAWRGNKDRDVDFDGEFTTEKSKASDDWDGLADEIPANREDPLVERACTVALRAWRALRCRDGGRVDIRMDGESADAVANVLEVSDVLVSDDGDTRAPYILDLGPCILGTMMYCMTLSLFAFLVFVSSWVEGVLFLGVHVRPLTLIFVPQINPLAGLRPQWSQLPIIAKHNRMSYETLLEHILRSALKRAPSRWRM